MNVLGHHHAGRAAGQTAPQQRHHIRPLATAEQGGRSLAPEIRNQRRQGQRYEPALVPPHTGQAGQARRQFQQPHAVRQTLGGRLSARRQQIDAMAGGGKLRR